MADQRSNLLVIGFLIPIPKTPYPLPGLVNIFHLKIHLIITVGVVHEQVALALQCMPHPNTWQAITAHTGLADHWLMMAKAAELSIELQLITHKRRRQRSMQHETVI